MVDFLFGKDMKKKDLIVMLPLFVALVVLVWILAGQEEALILLCSLLFTPTLIYEYLNQKETVWELEIQKDLNVK